MSADVSRRIRVNTTRTTTAGMVTVTVVAIISETVGLGVEIIGITMPGEAVVAIVTGIVIGLRAPRTARLLRARLLPRRLLWMHRYEIRL